MRDDRLRLRHASGTAPLARRERPLIGVEHHVAERARVLDVAQYLRVRPHAVVHRRHEQHRRLSREQARGEQVVGVAVHGAREKVRGARRDHDDVGCARELDVVECASRLDQLRVHLPPGERLERDRSHELRRAARHHDVHDGAGLRQQPGEPRRLVRGDPTGDA